MKKGRAIFKKIRTRFAGQGEKEKISVAVETIYLDEYSDPEKDHYVWAYNISIENKSGTTVRLLNRRWHIVDAQGQQRHIEGEGVVGEQPLILHGKAYEYTSGASLTVPSGVMQGQYEMQNENGRKFYIDIPAFSLDTPGHRPRLN